MLKKIIVTGFVLLTFVVYSIHQRGDTTPLVAQLSQTTMPNTTNTPSASNNTTVSTPSTTYKDGNYTGSTADAYYGYIQVRAIISGGKITDVQFLQHPNDRGTSVEINNYAMPILKQQAIQVQSAQVDGVSGASDTSQAFIQSLGDALQQAKA